MMSNNSSICLCFVHYCMTVFIFVHYIAFFFENLVSMYKQLVQINGGTRQQRVQREANDSQSTANVVLSKSRSFF